MVQKKIRPKPACMANSVDVRMQKQGSGERVQKELAQAEKKNDSQRTTNKNCKPRASKICSYCSNSGP